MKLVIFTLFVAQVIIGLVLIKYGVYIIHAAEGFGVLLIITGGWLIITALQAYRNITGRQHDADM